MRIAQLPWTSPQVVEIPDPKPARYCLFSFEAMAPGNNALRLQEIEAYLDADEAITTEPLTRDDWPAQPSAPPGGGEPGGKLQAGKWRGTYDLTTGGLQLKLANSEASFELAVSLKPDAQGASEGWHSVDAGGVPAFVAKSAAGGWVGARLTAERLGVRLSVSMPPPAPFTEPRSLMIRIPVSGARYRFIPQFLGSTEPATWAWPGYWLPTNMAAIQTDRGTFAIAPDTDRPGHGSPSDRHRQGCDHLAPLR